MYLDSLKAEKAAKVINDKKRSITDDVSEMKAKRRRMQQDISVLVNEADTLAGTAARQRVDFFWSPSKGHT